MNFTSVGGRRFFMVIGNGVVTSALVWFGKITPEVFAEIIKWTVGVYIGGGTVDNIKEFLVKKPPSQ